MPYGLRSTSDIKVSKFFLICFSKQQLMCWFVFVVRLTDESPLALFPGAIVRDLHHHESPTRCKQDLNLRRTQVQTLLNVVVHYTKAPDLSCNGILNYSSFSILFTKRFTSITLSNITLHLVKSRYTNYVKFFLNWKSRLTDDFEKLLGNMFLWKNLYQNFHLKSKALKLLRQPSQKFWLKSLTLYFFTATSIYTS